MNVEEAKMSVFVRPWIYEVCKYALCILLVNTPTIGSLRLIKQ